jgi:hypothetical protein
MVDTFYDTKKTKNTLIGNLFKVPTKDKGLNKPHYQITKPHLVQQADLLYLPNDGGYKYALVIVDAGNSYVDAQPLKSKNSAEVAKAFQTIYERKILKMPEKLEVDPGTEFKADVLKWLDEQDIKVRVGRHRQQAYVESANKTIGSILAKTMASREALTGDQSVEWIHDLPKLIALMNKKAKKRKRKALKLDAVCAGDSCKLFSVGDTVRVALEEPRDNITGKKLHGKFREMEHSSENY